MSRALALLAAALFALMVAAAPQDLEAAAPPQIAGMGGVYFDDSDPELLKLGYPGKYEVGFRKSNGGLAHILGEPGLTLGSRYECLWGVTFEEGASPPYVGGCSFHRDWPDRFSYAWDGVSQTLALIYTPAAGSAQRMAARVLVRASVDNWFDMQLSVTNHWGYTAKTMLFPSDLAFKEAGIKAALLPILPGVLLHPAFFDADRSYTALYPGYPGVFADFMSLSTASGSLAVYSLYGSGPLHPVYLGFVHDEEFEADSTFYYHTFAAWTPDGAGWTSPWVRVQIGGSPFDHIAAYRTANGLDRFPALAAKLGSRFAQVTRLPLYKADAAQLKLRFADYGGLLAQATYPGILHPVAFQPGGHDENYPDFLPPQSDWGTTAEMADMFRMAQARGFLVMPYTNPTWWDDESPTLTNLPAGLTIEDLAVIDESGQPVYEWYGSHGGYVMSPYPSFVRSRLVRLSQEMTVQLPSDMVFEDQIGARPWLYDFNASAPDPIAYTDGWLAHTETYSPTLRATELGFDRLGESEVGLHGSVLLPEETGQTSTWWGDGTWEPYPLATLMLRDKVLFYQHDLAPETFTTDLATLGWNLAMGYQLSYDLVSGPYGGGPASGWLDTVGALQNRILSRYAGERITGLVSVQTPAARASLTHFETCSALVNWDDADSFPWGRHQLAPHGSLVECGENVKAGAFTWYNGRALSAGDHVLIEERDPKGTTVRMPLGADSELTVAPVTGLSEGQPAVALAYAADGSLLGSTAATVTYDGVTFTCRRRIGGAKVDRYRISARPAAFLPYVPRK